MIAACAVSAAGAYVSGYPAHHPPPFSRCLQGAERNPHAWVSLWASRKSGWIGFASDQRQHPGETIHRLAVDGISPMCRRSTASLWDRAGKSSRWLDVLLWNDKGYAIRTRTGKDVSILGLGRGPDSLASPVATRTWALLLEQPTPGEKIRFRRRALQFLPICTPSPRIFFPANPRFCHSA